MEHFDLQAYLNNGIENIIKSILKNTYNNPKASIFMAKFALTCKRAAKTRQDWETQGIHIPPFLIASITSQCNLHCVGCYARSSNACTDCPPDSQLTHNEWARIFREAKELGIPFILLAGGEPVLRRDVLEEAGKISDILFPIFTNGTLFDESILNLLEKRRNLIPIFSIEGGELHTDNRRGNGVYQHLLGIMDAMHSRQLLYGVSVTVTKENIKEVTNESFIQLLHEKNCKAVFYVEYVPFDSSQQGLAPEKEERRYMENILSLLRTQFRQILFISFPGDEIASGGCLAAGRGFFHINSHGGAEPCPFSPYSDTNVKQIPLKDALGSPLFLKLRHNGELLGEHAGGCVLFQKKDAVEAFLKD